MLITTIDGCLLLVFGFFCWLIGRETTRAGQQEKTAPWVDDLPVRNRRPLWVILTYTLLAMASAIALLYVTRTRLDAAHGRPRADLRQGDYRVLYQAPDGVNAFIAPIGGGEPFHYRGSVPVQEGDEPCFHAHLVSYGTRLLPIACPATEE